MNYLIKAQIWKLLLAGLGVLLGGIGIFTPNLTSTIFNVDSIIINVMAIIVCMFSMIFAVLSIRCPNCKLKLVWYAISNKSFNEWLFWLFEVKECPNCNHKVTNK